MQSTKIISVMLCGSLTAFLAAGCIVVGPDFLRPESPAVEAYTPTALPEVTASADIAGGDAQRFIQDADVPGQWWTSFGSDALNLLVEQALANNPDLDAAQAALRQAGENYRAVRGPYYPSVTGNAAAQRQQQSQQFGNSVFNNVLNLYNVSVSVSYLLDVFGGTRRAVEAAGAQLENQRFVTEATYLALIANVLTAAIQEASLSAQIVATREIIAAQTQALDLTVQQFELGAVARGDVLAQQSQLTQTQAGLPTLQRQLAQVRTQLTVLSGRFPSEGLIAEVDLTDLQLPRELPLSVPSDLVNQRPDIRASEALLHAASAQIGIATANMLPQFNLSAAYGSTSSSTPGSATLFSSDSMVWNLGSSVSAPIFRGGALAGQRQAAIANYDRAAAQYRSTVLNAFADIANVLYALELDAETLRAQDLAERTAAQSLEITTERFRAGAIAYLPLLDAQRIYQQVRIALVQAQATRFADTVALFQALGGGWWNRNDIPGETASAE